MRSRSFHLGRILGVEIRLHVYFATALLLLLFQAVITQVPLRRAFTLWLLLLGAVAVREIARALVAAALHRDLRMLVLTPAGALPHFNDSGDSGARADRVLALSGPIANFLVSIALALLIFAVTPRVNLFQRPVIGAAHLLRAAVWLQMLMGAIHLLPASPTDAGTLLRREWMRVRGAARGSRSASGLGQAIGWMLVLTGAFTQEVLVLLVGGTILLNAQVEGHAVIAKEAAKDLLMRDVMLSEWTSLSASDTIKAALERSTHSLQEVFPVTRGPLVVGAVTRRSLLSTLRSDGDGYVQSAMSRSLHSARADDPLMITLQRIGNAAGISGAASAEDRRHSSGPLLLPIVQGSRVIGMVMPRNLSPAMISVNRVQRFIERGESGLPRDRSE